MTRKPVSNTITLDEDVGEDTRISYYLTAWVLSDVFDYINDPQYGLTQIEKDYLNHEISLMICAALY